MDKAMSYQTNYIISIDMRCKLICLSDLNKFSGCYILFIKLTWELGVLHQLN